MNEKEKQALLGIAETWYKNAEQRQMKCGLGIINPETNVPGRFMSINGQNKKKAIAENMEEFRLLLKNNPFQNLHLHLGTGQWSCIRVPIAAAELFERWTGTFSQRAAGITCTSPIGIVSTDYLVLHKADTPPEGRKTSVPKVEHLSGNVFIPIPPCVLSNAKTFLDFLPGRELLPYPDTLKIADMQAIVKTSENDSKMLKTILQVPKKNVEKEEATKTGQIFSETESHVNDKKRRRDESLLENVLINLRDWIESNPKVQTFQYSQTVERIFEDLRFMSDRTELSPLRLQSAFSTCFTEDMKTETETEIFKNTIERAFFMTKCDQLASASGVSLYRPAKQLKEASTIDDKQDQDQNETTKNTSRKKTAPAS